MTTEDSFAGQDIGTKPMPEKPTTASESALNGLLCWTANEPTEIGYYWFKAADFENAVIVDVFNHNGSMRFMIDGLYPGVSVEMVSSNARWSDKPIKRPIET